MVTSLQNQAKERHNISFEMPFALMDKVDEETSSFSGSDSNSPQTWGTGKPNVRMYQRRQRNRDAARKSRKKQTERADVLHEELQTLERSNSALVKEISELQKELHCYTTALKEHEPHCILSCWSGPSNQDMSTSDLPQPFNPNPGDQSILPMTDPITPDVSLSELLDRADWTTWDPDIRFPQF
ncbi:basic leucine zipper transcriptional factor ATF-like [Silurus meridionalis]|uniref:BZIP domain-containing protein n=1 Tax=Silurus meridionalis TaxID=175797 RepID=A0A8T0BL67_SILME|nr:basic leucine zipper transcriptional factor ATF-like [Silurus meridionalis]KAF7706357.1 hypothetical protein HF521_019611 [Silurus meridionalis]KAI5104274.1 basic leucine zipper transcriptional factor ATF-like [Silurus meridionalis]